MSADFGAMLRNAREARGKTLHEIADATKISVSALVALEENRPDQLPGGIFSRAFVRAYAEQVGLDREQTVQAFAKAFPRAVDPAAVGTGAGSSMPRHDASGRHGSGIPRIWGWAVTSVLVIGVIGFLATRSSDSVTPAEPPSSPEPVAADVPSPPPVRRDELVEETPPASDPVAGPLTIDVHPAATCWVSLVVDGERVVARIMEAGEREVHDARETIVLNVGDAGAFDFSINRQPGRSLGESGQVVTAEITHQNYSDFLASSVR